MPKSNSGQTSHSPDISIVIPAFNEKRFIGRQLDLLRQLTKSLATQIVVVDNGSVDGTPEIARQHGCDEVLNASGTVAAIRNQGAQHAKAGVLVFMDADVFPTELWADRIKLVVTKIAADARYVTGSWVSVPDDCSWIERYWFKPLENGQNSHINSGHFIIGRSFFDEIGGFDVRLRTGEDFDISMRAKAAGAVLCDDPLLRVIHEGYPKTLAEFSRREIWHGTGDCQSLRVFLSSKVALVGFGVLHLLALGTIVALVSGRLVWMAIPLCMGLGAAAVAASIRYKNASLLTRLVNSAMYFVYFCSRGLSPYAAARKARKAKPSGSRH